MLGYPGIFREALLSGAREINVQMKLVAAHVIADLTEASTSLVPDVLDPNVHERVAEAVRDAAIESGVRSWSACRRRGWQGGAWTRPPTARRFEEVDSVTWEIVPVSMMKLALSADHAIANGRDGALCTAEVKRVLENSVMLTV